MNTIAASIQAAPLTKYMTLEASCDSLIQGPASLGFRLTGNTLPINNGIRSELAIDYPFKEGQTVRYSFDMKLPEYYVYDDAANRWWSIAQWHDQPDRTKNETWSTFAAHSPPVFLYIEQRFNRIVGMGLSTDSQRKHSWAAVPINTWLRISVTVKWSQGADGVVSVSVLDHPEFSDVIYGKNMFNGYQHYMKIGQYRRPEITSSTNVLYRYVNITTVTP